MSVRILTKNVEVSINNGEVSREWIRDKRVRGANQELGKLASKEILQSQKNDSCYDGKSRSMWSRPCKTVIYDVKNRIDKDACHLNYCRATNMWYCCRN